jgi:hypothetical protein
LGVHPVRGLVEDEKAARPQERGSETEPLFHTERIGAVALRRRRAETNLGQRGIDATAAGAALPVRPGGVDALEVLATGQPGIEGRAFHERSDVWQHPRVGGRHVLAEQAV